MNVNEIMSRHVVSVGPDTSVKDAVRLMTLHGVSGLPVVDDEDRLVGVVSGSDIARSFVRTDDDIREAIEALVLGRVLHLSPDAIEVMVVDGVAHLAGGVDRRSTAEIVVSLTSRVDGVVAVKASLTWAFDDTLRRAVERGLVAAVRG